MCVSITQYKRFISKHVLKTWKRRKTCHYRYIAIKVPFEYIFWKDLFSGYESHTTYSYCSYLPTVICNLLRMYSTHYQYNVLFNNIFFIRLYTVYSYWEGYSDKKRLLYLYQNNNINENKFYNIVHFTNGLYE